MCFRRISSSRHFVCLPCRACYKKRSEPQAVLRCPRCRGELIDAGHDLAVPARRDTAGWRALTALLNAGVTFHSSCCDGPGWRPRTPAEIKSRLAASAGTGIPAFTALTTSDLDELREKRPS
ncbi:hypothetical protein F7Q99_31085 [Streptomyces kaniharaensis]|uniref:Deoxyxylulose-5-phosphate synthase n=1 Tax=Streptomyces kaniharaensis TaxID=212423 RepID=A0A6N7L1Y5_9ACTN|nr:hypothetical protein [Streptomyces kaniharaensis]MQS16518.1 hypothetical protein [Streptomyces kaniharaensis]